MSNFAGHGPAKVGASQAVGLFGTYDMGGNVREWCWNQTGDRHYILGGAWNDPPYLFVVPVSLPPFDRSETNGFRTAHYITPLPDLATSPVSVPFRDFSREKPVRDDVFRVYKEIYSYDRSDLKPVVEAVEKTAEWRREKISFNAAYGNERVTAHLFLPENAPPPYQTVIYFPHLAAVLQGSAEPLQIEFMSFLVRSGRAVMYPVYKGTNERHIEPPPVSGSRADRDRAIQWSKDFSRSIDYLQTRPDIDGGKLAFFGVSLGAYYAPLLTAIDGRLKASVLYAGGLKAMGIGCCFRPLPEVDPFNFLAHDQTPTLMINGRSDLLVPLETSQIPMFRLLGAPAKDKRHVVLEGGHVSVRFQEVIKETLDWLDRYQGPVKSMTGERGDDVERWQKIEQLCHASPEREPSERG